MRNVHEDRADAVSVALGALVSARSARPRRDQEADRRREERGRGGSVEQPARAGSGESGSRAGVRSAAATARPIVPPDVPQYFSPEAAAAVSSPLRPVVYGAVNVRFVDPKLKVDTTKLVTCTTPIWRRRGCGGLGRRRSASSGRRRCSSATRPTARRSRRCPRRRSRRRTTMPGRSSSRRRIAAGEALELFRSPSTGELSRPGRVRARVPRAHPAGRRASRAIARSSRSARSTRRGRRRSTRSCGARSRRSARESEQATGQKLQTAISVGATLVGALFGTQERSAPARSAGRRPRRAASADR